MASDASNLSRVRARAHAQRRHRRATSAPGLAVGAIDPSKHWASEAVIDCGWGRLVFAHTFDDPESLIRVLRSEGAGRRDIAFYVADPHVLLAKAPFELFIDPSHTYRLDTALYRASRRRPSTFFVRRLGSETDAREVNRIYQLRGMVPVDSQFFWSQRDTRAIVCLVAEDVRSGAVLGTVMGVDHAHAFDDPQHGSSLWCLAVDPQAEHPGVGEALVRHLVEYFKARGCAYVDLSVLHDNEAAVSLYERLGFRRLQSFAIKRKNSINEHLFVGPQSGDDLNPYARIIADEALRRGIQVEVLDAEGGFIRLVQGARSVRCRESLSELTSAVAMSICDDKAVTRRVVQSAGVRVPGQITIQSGEFPERRLREFLEMTGRVVVKPARGEQGRGIAVGVRRWDELELAIRRARSVCEVVLVEQMVEGEDIRIVVIDFKVVAAAIRRRPRVIGDGSSRIRELIEVQSRRRSAATGGESVIPVDDETERTLARVGCSLESIPPPGQVVEVRGTANLHTGGTIHDVTDQLHPELAAAAIAVARAIDIPVVGVDLLSDSPQSSEYHFIEANERPGLANHEPQPTAQRFVDLLFPRSMARRSTASKGRT
ncbi:MAG: N-acetylglutaminylglutamine synthetase [Burkholderiaceae bacterium]